MPVSQAYSWTQFGRILIGSILGEECFACLDMSYLELSRSASTCVCYTRWTSLPPQTQSRNGRHSCVNYCAFGVAVFLNLDRSSPTLTTTNCGTLSMVDAIRWPACEYVWSSLKLRHRRKGGVLITLTGWFAHWNAISVVTFGAIAETAWYVPGLSYWLFFRLRRLLRSAIAVVWGYGGSCIFILQTEEAPADPKSAFYFILPLSRQCAFFLSCW